MKRLTKQRKTVMSALEGRKDHPTAEDLYYLLKNNGINISISTVYRTLTALAKQHSIMEIHGYGPIKFDPNPDPHYHFYCIQCNNIYDIDISYRKELDKIKITSDFNITGHQLIWHGICPKCQGLKNDNNKN